MGDKTEAMGNQHTCDQNQHVTQTIPAPAPPESSRNKSIQEAMDKDLDGIADGYDHTKDFKENLKLCDPTKDYTKKDELGKGQFGTVYRVVHKQSKIEYAMKEIIVSKSDQKSLQREMAIALSVDHEYLLEMKDCYKHTNNHRLEVLSVILPIMERSAANQMPDLMTWLCARGEDIHGEEGGLVTELEGAKITHHVGLAMKYLHDNLESIHRDLKPENVLVGPDGIDALKVCDYGLARHVDPNSEAGKTMGHGTPGYMAREMILGSGHRGDYDAKVDVFALGVILYSAMVMMPPFTDHKGAASNNPIFNSVPANFSAQPWRRISKPCKDLCAKMLAHDATQRCTMDEVLAHPWLTSQGLLGCAAEQ